MSYTEQQNESLIKYLCVYEDSEESGNAQKNANELFFLFNIYVNYPDKNLTESENKRLREIARMLYIRELEKSGVIVKYEKPDIKSLTVFDLSNLKQYA